MTDTRVTTVALLCSSSKKAELKKMQKFTIRNFTILLSTLVETLPRGTREFCRVNLVCTFRADVL